MPSSRLVRRGRAAATCALLATAFGLAPRLARADEVVPPKLAQSASASDPRAAETTEALPRVAIDLEIEIDPSGVVTHVRVVDPSSETSALESAATAAAAAFVFEPATRDGVPVAARIRYQYVFAERRALPSPPATATEEPPPAEAPPPPPDESFGATARVEAPPRETTKRTFTGDEMLRMPGTRGDPIRAIELMPGVGRPAAGTGNPILRGANLADSQVFAEGAPVPILFHFGGLSSFAHGRVLDAVDVYPSNFSVRYGRKVGGVVDVRFRDPKTDRFRGVADLSLLESSLLVETPIGDKVSVMAAARRSNIDAVLNTAVSDASFAITAAPVYWDYQGVFAYRPTDSDRLRLVAFGSQDRFAALFKQPADTDPAIRGALEQTLGFHNVQLGWRHRFRGGSEHTTELTYGRLDSKEGAGSIAQGQFGMHVLQGRSETAVVLTPAVRLVGGVDILATQVDGRYTGIAQPPDEGGNPMVLATQKKVSVDASAWIVQPAAYLEAGLRPFPRLLLTPGVRADHNDFVAQSSIDPRLSARWEITDETALKGGVGRYTGHPQESRVVAPIGNPNLGFTHSTHASVGVEQKLPWKLSVGVEGFAKWIDGIVAGTPGGRAPFYFNSQEGRVVGGELLARFHPSEQFFGFVSYTLMRSERRDFGQDWRLFDRDTPQIVSAAGVYRLGRGWEVGATLRYTSGIPYTPVASSTYEATNDVYLPRFGAPMSARNPAFVRLDVRVEKKWTFNVWSLALYLDVQNVLNSPNREGFSYSYDYTRRQGARGLPIFPALGLRGEL